MLYFKMKDTANIVIEPLATLAFKKERFLAFMCLDLCVVYCVNFGVCIVFVPCVLFEMFDLLTFYV